MVVSGGISAAPRDNRAAPNYRLPAGWMAILSALRAAPSGGCCHFGAMDSRRLSLIGILWSRRAPATRPPARPARYLRVIGAPRRSRWSVCHNGWAARRWRSRSSGCLRRSPFTPPRWPHKKAGEEGRAGGDSGLVNGAEPPEIDPLCQSSMVSAGEGDIPFKNLGGIMIFRGFTKRKIILIESSCL